QWCDMVFLDRRIAFGLAVCLAACSGCLGPRRTAPSVDPNTLSDQGFMNYVAEAPVVTVNEAYRSILILADAEDTSKTFEERQSKLLERKIARPEWRLEPDNIIDQGAVAEMICRVCHIR